jgi:transposase InsO family protein
MNQNGNSVATPPAEAPTKAGPEDGADVRARPGRRTDEWHLVQTFAPVGRPTGNAVVERVIRTLKEEVIWPRNWDSADEVRAAVDAWVRHYNHQRPHQALDYATPAEFRVAKVGAPATGNKIAA